MERDKMSLGSQVKVVGVFLGVSGLLGGVLVTFIVPGNGYFAGVALLMLSIILISGLIVLAIGAFLSWHQRGVFTRAMALPAVLLARLLGKG
jgi:hypothetical protein